MRTSQESFLQKFQPFFHAVQDLQKKAEEGPRAPPPGTWMPSSNQLPECLAGNPWRDISRVPFQNGLFIFQDIGSRPLSDLEKYPKDNPFPWFWVRLNDENFLKMDRIKKETLIVPKEAAQQALVQVLSSAQCPNSMSEGMRGIFTTFLTNPKIEHPFNRKVVAEVWESVIKDKACPSFRECDPTSLVLPNPASLEFYKGADKTFIGKKLPNNIAAEQFREDLPKLPERLLTAEFEARSRLALSLHSLSLTEFLMESQAPDWSHNILVSKVKAELQAFILDFYAWGRAKKACREHVLFNATRTVEVIALLDSSPWGNVLFPEEAVAEAKQAAASANQTLRHRWGMEKRKYSEFFGQQPKNKKFKFPKKSYTNPAPPPSAPAPPPATDYYSSPAYNAQYHLEAAPRGNFGAFRGGRSRPFPGNRGRGAQGYDQQGQGQNQRRQRNPNRNRPGYRGNWGKKQGNRGNRGQF